MTASALNTTNGIVALRVAILKSLNDSSITLGQISILNITTNPGPGGGVKTAYRVFFNSASPRATYDKLTSSLNHSITSGYFTSTLKSSAQQLNVPGVTNVVATSFNIHPLDTASPPSATPTFTQTVLLSSKPSSKPTAHPTYKPSAIPVQPSLVPSMKPVYQYPTSKPVYQYPTNKPVSKPSDTV